MSAVRNCSIHSVGCGGMQLSGGSMRGLRRGDNEVTHTPPACGVVCSQPDDLKRKSCEQAVGNVIQGHSRWARARSPGIFWAGVGNRFVSNTIRHTPDMAIYGGGNQAGEEGGSDNLFQDNTISRAMFETTDTGVTRPSRLSRLNC